MVMSGMTPAQPAGERAMVELARTGDEEAFDGLFYAYNTRICTFLARMVGNDEEGRDRAQETFLKAWRTLSSIQDEARFSSWLYRIATNVAIDHLRVQRLRRFLSLGWPAEEQTIYLQTPGPEEQIAEAEYIQLALAQVTPKNRACLLLQIEGGSRSARLPLCSMYQKSLSASM
jgi:RNA polymerase sigma-70 factor (ECF subfamily)